MQIREIAESDLNFLIASLIGDPLTDIASIQRPRILSLSSQRSTCIFQMLRSETSVRMGLPSSAS